MKGDYNELITKPLLLDMHMNEDMFSQHPKGCLLEAK
jgi:hypothetical protein